MEYTYKYRIYPNDIQKTQLNKTFGCTRFVYNHLLSKYDEFNSKSKIALNNYVNRELKNRYEWLKEPDKFAITNAVYNFNDACNRYHSGLCGKPNFKKKRMLQSYQTNYTNNNIEVLDNYIKLPKLKKVKVKVHRPLEGRIINATIKRYSDNRYYCLILVDKDIPKLDKNSFGIGLDMGVKSFATDDYGFIYNAPDLTPIYNKIGILQAKLSKKAIHSNNWYKLQLKINKLYSKADNIRMNFLHQLSSKVIKENQFIAIEDLDVMEMFQNNNISKTLGRTAVSRFLNYLEYKAKWYGRNLIKINRYYPSSQKCFVCGYKNPDVKDLSVREWTCPECKTHHLRDKNAAINILIEGLRILYNN